MNEDFRRFIEAEIHEIMESMDEQSRHDPTLCSTAAIDWISRHAKTFREAWERDNHFCDARTNGQQCA